MFTNETIKTFIRDTLGCTCPDEVFKNIVCEDNIKLTNEYTLSHRINIGDRLLIYIYNMSKSVMESMDISMLVNCGEQQRNELGFNRFRLVLLCDYPDEINDKLNASFASLKKDDNIHLHILHVNDFPA